MRILWWLLILLLLPVITLAQEQKASVSLITIGPGDASYERFGHNMLRIHDPSQDLDVVFNWGIFDFEEENFILNFIQGRLWYWMAGGDTQRTLDYYRGLDRTIWGQELNLSPAQVKSLIDFCEWNARPANRGYQYDYFKDNCSTRVRDALDQSLHGQIKRQATTRPSDVTFRSETRRLMASVLPLYVGLNYVLGTPTDQQLSVWDEMFIPMRMRERLSQFTVIDEHGARIPLVRSETVLHQSGHIHERSTPPRWMGWFLLVGLIIGAGQGWLGYRARAGSRRRRWMFGAAAIGWCLLAGVAGVILSYLWLATDHAASRPNESILQMGPWSLLLVILIPLALRRLAPSTGNPGEVGSQGLRPSGWKGMAVRVALFGTMTTLGLSFLGTILQVLPIMDQVNGEIIALALPAHAGLAWGVWQLHTHRGDSKGV